MEKIKRAIQIHGLNKIFNADPIAARNILITPNNVLMTPVTLSPERGRGNGRRPGQGLNLQEEGCSPNLPPQAGRGSGGR